MSVQAFAANWTPGDPAAGKIHHISLATAITHGRKVADVARQLNDRLRGLTLYCNGWAQDCVWLNVLFEAAGLAASFKLDKLRGLLTEQEAAFWGIVKQQVATEMRLPRHRGGRLSFRVVPARPLPPRNIFAYGAQVPTLASATLRCLAALTARRGAA